MTRRTFFIGLAASSSVLALGSSLVAFRKTDAGRARAAVPEPISDRSVYVLGSRFENDDGRSVRLVEFAGRVQVLAMMFTSCPTVCPTLVREILALDRDLPARLREKTHVVFVSIDPERDTPERLRRYRDKMGLARERFDLLRGDPRDVRELAQVIGVAYAKTEGADIAHSRLVTVLDRGGAVVHQQAGVSDDRERLVQGIFRADGTVSG